MERPAFVQVALGSIWNAGSSPYMNLDLQLEPRLRVKSLGNSKGRGFGAQQRLIRA